MGLYAELRTLLDTKTYVVTLRGEGWEEGRRGEGGGDCLQSENILFLLPTHQCKERPCSADWLVMEAFTIDLSSTPDTGGLLWSSSCLYWFLRKTHNCRNIVLNHLFICEQGAVQLFHFRFAGKDLYQMWSSTELGARTRKAPSGHELNQENSAHP